MAKDNQKIRIKVKSFDHKLLDEAVKTIVNLVKETGTTVVGPIPLPTKVEKITVNRSTFVNKDAREQFEIRRHKRLIELQNTTPESLEVLKNLNIPTGVGVEIKVDA